MVNSFYQSQISCLNYEKKRSANLNGPLYKIFKSPYMVVLQAIEGPRGPLPKNEHSHFILIQSQSWGEYSFHTKNYQDRTGNNKVTEISFSAVISPKGKGEIRKLPHLVNLPSTVYFRCGFLSHMPYMVNESYVFNITRKNREVFMFSLFFS